MKKFILFVFSLIIGLAVFCGLNVKATGIALTMTNGASVRTTGEYQGLRFQANVDTLEGSIEHGFFLALGEHSLSDMTTAINADAETVGGYKLVKKATTGADLTFAVTVYDITNTYYTTGITAVAFVYDGSSYTLNKAVTRNIAEVSLAALQEGENASLLKTVVDYSYYAVNFSSTLKAYIAGNSVYESIVDNIKTEFMDDWHTYNGSISTSNLISAFQGDNKTSLKEFAKADNNLSTGARKWHWLWGYLSQYNTYKNEVLHLYTDSEEEDDDSGYTLLYQLYNFFTNSSWKKDIEHSNSVNSREIRFWDHPEYYAQIGAYNNKLEANHEDANTIYVLKNSSFELPAYTLAEKDYYTVTGWNDGSSTYASGVSHTLSANKIFKPVYTANTYTVTYMDGETNISSSFASSYKSFTIESSALILPIFEKDGYKFEGWYDNAGLTGSAITTIPEGSHDNKVFYAKTTAGDTVSLILAMNDGSGDTDVLIKVKGDAITTVPVRGAYIFNGWFDNAEGTGSAVTTVPNSDTTLYAKWTAMTVSSIRAVFLTDISDVHGSSVLAGDFYTTFNTNIVDTLKNSNLAKYQWLIEYIESKNTGTGSGNKYIKGAMNDLGYAYTCSSSPVLDAYSNQMMANDIHNFLNAANAKSHGGSGTYYPPVDFTSINSDELLAAAAAANFSYAKYN